MLKQLFIIGSILVLLQACSKQTVVDNEDQNMEDIGFYGTRIIHDEFNGVQMVVVASYDKNYMVSFENIKNKGNYIEFSPIFDSLPYVMRDPTGTVWNIWGVAVEGPLKDARLKPVSSLMGYYFAFAAFYPELEIYGEPNNNSSVSLNLPDTNWLIDVSRVYAGTVVKDAIPSVDQPQFINFRKRDFLDGFFVQDEDLILGLLLESGPVAYPHSILNWHEIVNDKSNGLAFSINYCPLSGTGMCWNRTINQVETTFGVSGLLYNSNLMPYDRETQSIWSQIRSDCVKGELITTKIDFIPVIETKWSTWKDIYPETRVLSLQTGYDWPYDQYPYGDYITNNDFIAYPLTNYDSRIPNKERVHCVIINGNAKVYRFENFQLQDPLLR